jgi:polyisoprenoid-binding protein YceI
MSTLATPQTSAATTWNLDPAHSVAEFKVRHMMISNVKGQFPKVTGVLTLDETGDAQRDAHLKSPDFLDAEKFPSLSFKSTKVRLAGNGEPTVEGDLTIHGVTRKVVFAVEGPTPAARDPWGNTRIAISATTKISRKDFGLTWNAALESGGILVGDEVTITLDVQFVKA